MAMPIDEQKVTDICAELTRTVALAIKAGEFPPEQLSPACKEIHTLLDSVNTQEGLITMLTDMTSRYPVFSPILESIQKQQKAAANVEQMFERNTKTANA